MRGNREVHLQIRRKIEHALGGRTWTWLATEAGVPQSTLAGQAGKPKFSLDVLLAIAEALGEPVAAFLPDGHSGGSDEDAWLESAS